MCQVKGSRPHVATPRGAKESALTSKIAVSARFIRSAMPSDALRKRNSDQIRADAAELDTVGNGLPTRRPYPAPVSGSTARQNARLSRTGIER